MGVSAMPFSANLILLAIALGAGFALVYLPLRTLVRAWLGSSQDQKQASDGELQSQVISQEEAHEILFRLHRVADNVGRDVTAHTAEMVTISQGDRKSVV